MVEDDAVLAEEMALAFAELAWRVTLAATLQDGMRQAAFSQFDAIVLDRSLPDGEGLDLLARLRGMEVFTPVLVLSALHETAHRLAGFARGADDYLGKPFSMEELSARLLALRRRAQAGPHPSVIVVDQLEIWMKAGSAVRAGQRLELSDTELRLLILLAEHEGALVTRRMILERIFGYRVGVDPGTNVAEVAMSRLRAKLDKPFAAPAMIETVRHQGYVLRRHGPND